MNEQFGAQIAGAGYTSQAETKMSAEEYRRGQLNVQQVRDRSPIEQAMDEIDQAIEQLSVEVNELGARLIPVSRLQGNGLASGFAQPGIAKPDIVQTSPVEERLRALAQRVRTLVQHTSANRNALAI